jgi:hypothetical protein
MAMVMTHVLERLSHPLKRRGTVKAGVLLAAIIAVDTAFYVRSLIN